MKKAVLIFAIELLMVLVVLSCSKDDDGCVCKTAKYLNFGQSGYFYSTNVPIDCKTGRPLQQLPSNPNAIFVSCEDN
jgi:hypothetical protein